MPDNKNNSNHYRKLSRRSGSLATYHQLWCGKDHLLLVQEAGCSEEYKRFYFQDIQAVITTRTAGYFLWAIIMPILALMLAALPTLPAVSQAAPVFYWIAGILGALWLVHLLKGPTCKCWIQTGINLERLIMFRRTRQADRFLEKIEPKLAETQGLYSEKEMVGAVEAES